MPNNLTTEQIDAWRDRNPLVRMMATDYVYDLTGKMTISVVYAQHVWMHSTVPLDSFENGLAILCDELGLEGLKVEEGVIHGLRARGGIDDWLSLYKWVKENGEKV